MTWEVEGHSIFNAEPPATTDGGT